MPSEQPDQTIRGAISNATRRLGKAGSETARLDADVLLGYLLGATRTKLAIDAEEILDAAVLVDYENLIDRRIGKEPVAYIVGKREFMGHEFAVGPGVLVPRPETELLVEWAVATIDKFWPREPVRVLDLCTGSGAIACSLALLVSDDRVSITGSDASPDALRYAQVNRELLGLTGRVTFVEGDLLEWTETRWDMILSNPPYLTPEQIDGNADLAAEPRLALDGGELGLDVIARILEEARSRFADRFAMIIEIDPSQADAVLALAAAQFSDASVEIVTDLTGRARFVSIQRKERAP